MAPSSAANIAPLTSIRIDSSGRRSFPSDLYELGEAIPGGSLIVCPRDVDHTPEPLGSRSRGSDGKSEYDYNFMSSAGKRISRIVL